MAVPVGWRSCTSVKRIELTPQPWSCSMLTLGHARRTRAMLRLMKQIDFSTERVFAVTATVPLLV
jgi:hypothetical protein